MLTVHAKENISVIHSACQLALLLAVGAVQMQLCTSFLRASTGYCTHMEASSDAAKFPPLDRTASGLYPLPATVLCRRGRPGRQASVNASFVAAALRSRTAALDKPTVQETGEPPCTVLSPKDVISRCVYACVGL